LQLGQAHRVGLRRGIVPGRGATARRHWNKMVTFLGSQLDYGLLLYGAAFLLLALVCLGGRKKIDAMPWKWLGLFGLAHGLREWMDIATLSLGDCPTYYVVRIVVAAGSFLLLVEFARASLAVTWRRTPGRWVHVPLLLAAGLGALTGQLSGLDASSRYALGMVGAAVSAVALVRASWRMRTAGRIWLSLLGAAMGLYAVFAGMVVPPAEFFPANVLNQDTFLKTFGQPAQLLRGALACAIAWTFWRYTRAIGSIEEEPWRAKARERSAFLLTLGLAAALAGGWVGTEFAGRTEDGQYRSAVLNRAVTAAASMDPAKIASLSCSREDYASANYRYLKEQLASVRGANPDTRFVYLTRLVGGKIRFLVDPEPVTSKDHSPPGSAYDAATPEFLAIFRLGKGITEGPLPDEFGVWVSGLAPVRDRLSGRVIAVLGMDIAAKDWGRGVALARAYPIGITCLLSALLVGFYVATQRQAQAADRILDSQRTYRSLVEGSSSAIAMIDANGRYMSLNGPGLRAMGWAEKDVAGKPFLSSWPTGTHPTVADAIHQALQGGRNSFEADRLCAHGRPLTWNVTLNPIVEEQGRVHRIVVVSNDVTEHRRAEEEVIRAKEAAEQANRAKSDFLAKMSHEIRTPMNGVIGMACLLMNTDLSGQQRRYTRIIRTSAEALLTVINDVLDFSKIEAGKLDLRPSDFDLCVAVEEVVEMFSQKAGEKGLELAAVIEPPLPTVVRGDKDRFRQILTNLVGNAMKFTDAGEVIVRAEPAGQSPGKVLVRFTVRDTGPGISPDGVSKLFQSFSQVDTSTTRRYGGTGLGLAISKRLAEMMGGQIGVDSQVGLGSTFWFTIGFDACAPAAAPAPPSLLDLTSRRVLVVDDNAANREVLHEQLRSWSLRSESAPDGPTALDMLRRSAQAGQPFRIVILDSGMPGMSGLELSRAIRRDPQIPPGLLLLMLQVGDAVEPSALTEAGVNAVLAKPVRQSKLFDAIVEATTQGEAGRRNLRADLAQTGNLACLATSRGARILLAEDNEINQELGAEILTVAGYRCQVVPNGLEAVDALMKERFDLVLMDYQMPEMDGLEATRAIRQKEQAGMVLSRNGGHIPIVALTANAISGERDKCLEAGMDGYVTKPIVPEELIRAIESALAGVSVPAAPPAAQTRPAAEAPGPSSPSLSPAPADASSPAGAEGAPAAAPFDIRDLLERCLGNRDLAARMLGKFAARVREDLERLERTVLAGDAAGAARLAHGLKGMSANLSAVALWQGASQVERACLAGRLEEATAGLPALRAEVIRCLGQEPQFLADLVSPTAGHEVLEATHENPDRR
jgi:PAS domain S-box-containing protein